MNHKVLILGAGGYLGWPASLYFASRGYEVLAVDNDSKQSLMQETGSRSINEPPSIKDREIPSSLQSNLTAEYLDCRHFSQLESCLRKFQPDTVIHLAEQPSAPLSMQNFDKSHYTLINNLETTHNILWAICGLKKRPHLLKLGTMGEYGTPNIDIEEGWLEIRHNSRSDKFLYPRQASSLYHTTKIMDTDLIWFFVRTHQLAVTDLMQGPVFGCKISEDSFGELFSELCYDDIFGTVINRFAAQAARDLPLTVYGSGNQIRGYIALQDSLRCMELATENPPQPGDLSIYNQFTSCLSINEIADTFVQAGKEINKSVAISRVTNPRVEKEEHYYNPQNTKLLNLGLEPHPFDLEAALELVQFCLQHQSEINTDKILPSVTWKK